MEKESCKNVHENLMLAIKKGPSLKRGLSECGHGFGGCDGLSGFGRFNVISGFGGFSGFDGLDGFSGFSGFGGSSGFGIFVF